MADSSADRDPLDVLAEEFVARFRAGERPPLTEYAARLPDRADEVRELFPALVELEQLKPTSGDRTGDYTPEVNPADPVRVGEFRILRRVGVGGMGAVYEAIQESLGRHVALKLLPHDSAADPGRLERFRREAKAAARLHHTNIVPVFGTGEADGRHYYAMQFIAGHPLDAVIDEVKRLKDKSAAPTPRAVTEVANALVTGTFPKSPSPLEGEGVSASADATRPTAPTPPPSDTGPVSSPSLSDGGRTYWATVARLGAQVADALAYAHGQGVLHRDIKPANLLLDLRGTVWVADFGLAKSNDADDLTLAGDVVGTIRYMAPERFEGQGDHRVDVYALGLTLYELLALRPAFQAPTRAKLVEQVLTANPPRPRSINPAIPRDLETVVLKAIQRDPAMRYQQAAELADDLRRFLEDRSILARRATPLEQGWRWCRRNPAVSGLLAVVLLVFALGAGVASAFAVRADDERRNALAREGEATDERNRANEEAEKLKVAKEQQAADRYLSDMQLIPIPFQAGSTAEVNKLLERHIPKPGEPDRRGFEWYYWTHQQNQQVLTDRLPDCEDSTNDAWKVSDDGRRIARLVSRTKADDRPVLTVWDRTTRRVVLHYPLPITPPGDGTASASAAAFAPQFSPDGRRVVVEWSYSGTFLGGPGSGVAGGRRPTRQGSRLRQVIDVDTGKMLLDLSESAPSNSRSTTRSGFSFDGRRFGHVSWDTSFQGDRPRSELLVWDLETGTAIPTAAEFKHCSRMAFHPDGETCVTVSPVETPAAFAAVTGGVSVFPTTCLALRDVRTGVARWSRLVPWGSLINLTVSPDGILIAGTPIQDLLTQSQSVYVWEASTGREVSSCPIPEHGFGAGVTDLAFSPNGSRVAITWNTVRVDRPTALGGLVMPVGSSRRFTILDPRTGTPFPPIDGWSDAQSPRSFRLQQVAYSPDGKQVYVPGDSTIRTWEVRTGLPHRSFRGPVDPPGACGFTADGTRLWSAERDGLYKEWDLRPPRPVAVDFQGGNPRLTPDFAVSGDGGRFAHLVRTQYLWDDAAEFAVRMRDGNGSLGKLLTPPPRAVGPKPFTFQSSCGLALDRDGRRVLLTRREFKTRGLTGQGLLRGGLVGEVAPADLKPGLPPPDLTVWDTDTGQRLFHQSIDGQLMPAPGGDGFVAILSPDGREVAVGVEPAKEGDPVRVRVFDVESGRERTPLTFAGATTLFTLAYSPDGKRLAAVAAMYDRDKNRLSARLVVWKAGGEPTLSAELYRDAKVSALGYASTFRAGVVWTPDGSRLVVSHARPLNAGFAVHDATTGEAVVTLERPVNRSGLFPTGVVCSPDGKRAAAFLNTGGNEQPAVKVWDMDSGKEVLTLRKQQNTEQRGGGPPRSKDRQLAFTADGHRLLGWEFGEVPEWSPETGTVMMPAYSRSVWDATPTPPQPAREADRP